MHRYNVTILWTRQAANNIETLPEPLRPDNFDVETRTSTFYGLELCEWHKSGLLLSLHRTDGEEVMILRESIELVSSMLED
jgi:hypothetical protein